VKTRKLGARGPAVSALGLGCWSMTTGYGRADETESAATLQRAIDLGVTFFDTADIYGRGENEELLGRAIRGVRDKLFIASKCGFVMGPTGNVAQGVDGRPEHIRASIDGSLRRLGIDVLDLYYLHRMDKKVPLEDQIGAFADLVKAGKIRHVGLSEVKDEQIAAAHQVHPITAVQNEYSLWTRDSDGPVIDTCRRLGIGFVPYSPLGRGFLTGTVTAETTFDEGDIRPLFDRFQGDNAVRNVVLVARLKDIAARKNISTAQLALAWVLAQGDDMVPIPGTKRRTYLEDNLKALDVVLTPDDLAEIEALDIAGNVAGHRAGRR